MGKFQNAIWDTRHGHRIVGTRTMPDWNSRDRRRRSAQPTFETDAAADGANIGGRGRLLKTSR